MNTVVSDRYVTILAQSNLVTDQELNGINSKLKTIKKGLQNLIFLIFPDAEIRQARYS